MFSNYLCVELCLLVFIQLACLQQAQQPRKPQSLLDSRGCGQTHSCWFTPPGCIDDVSTCNEMIKWRENNAESVSIELQGATADIGKSFMGHYMSVAFSHDDKMGDDTVLECVARPAGPVTAYLSFNDGTHNTRLRNATRELLARQSGTFINGKIVCNVVMPFRPTSRVDPKEKWQVFDLTNDQYILQFARGLADPETDSMIIHHLLDGDKFPWIATERVRIKRDSPNDQVVLNGGKHYDIARSAQYQMVVAHGILFLFAWWVFGAVAMFMARYFKPLWPGKMVYGRKVWYQFHRNLFIISLVLQCIAFILIFVQAGDFKLCTHVCDHKDYMLFLHTVLGVVCTGLAILQPFLAWIRPSTSNAKRPIFNWSHWLIGQTTFVLATVTIYISGPLGKSGLHRNFGRKPDYIMAAYIILYIVTSIILEMMVTCTEKPKNKIAAHTDLPMQMMGPAIDRKPVPVSNKPSTVPILAPYRTIVLIIFTLTAIGLCAALSYQIDYNLHTH